MCIEEFAAAHECHSQGIDLGIDSSQKKDAGALSRGPGIDFPLAAGGFIGRGGRKLHMELNRLFLAFERCKLPAADRDFQPGGDLPHTGKTGRRQWTED